MGWKIILPNVVKVEATRKSPLDSEIADAINNGEITEVFSNKVTYNTIRSRHANLGDGELDSFAIVNDCLDKAFRPYIILSDDEEARKHGERLGIKFVGILPVVALANNHGLLSRQKALEYVDSLKKNNFTPRRAYLDSFVKSLRQETS